MGITTNSIRNISIAGHVHTGKTTLTEQILFFGGTIPKPETVKSGKTVSDYSNGEIEKKISIHATLTNIKWESNKINIFDTPGSSDFIGEVISSFRASDSTLLLVAADAGVQIGTIKIWRRLTKLNKPRIIFINKMDKEHADFSKLLDDINDKFKATFVPITIPIGNAADHKGVVNLLDMKAYIFQENAKPKVEDIPADMKDMVDEYRFSLIEAAAEGDDILMEKYLEEETLTEDEIVKGLGEGLAANKYVPILSGAALKSSGISSLLDFISKIAPIPCTKEKGINDKGEEIEQQITTDGKFSCFVIKTSIDQFSGKLSYIKVVTGKITPDFELYNTKNAHKEKISKIYTCQGKKLIDTNEIIAGDIGILTKLDSAETNDTLSALNEELKYSPIDVPQPAHAVAITAANKKDEDKLNQLLIRESEEDLTFKIKYNKETKETVISCMGELQLSIVLNKIKNKQKIEVETKIPKIAYRETIRKFSSAEYQHKKQTGGHGQYAKVVLEIKPIERGKKFEFVNAIFGGAVSRGYIPGVEKGILKGMENGILAGYPVVDLEAKIVDGKEHPVDSSELSFKLASRGALKLALEKANPVLLEPVMSLEVFVDNAHLGDVLSDLSSRRGRVQGQEPIGGGIQLVKAQVPQSELLRYSIDLKSITSGTASFEIEFDHYNPISGKVAEDVIKTSKASGESN